MPRYKLIVEYAGTREIRAVLEPRGRDIRPAQRRRAQCRLRLGIVERGQPRTRHRQQVRVQRILRDAAAEVLVRRAVVAQLLLRDAEPAEEVGVVRPGLEGFAEHPGHVVPLPLVTEGKGAFEDLVDGTSHFTHQTSRAGPHGPAPGSSA